MKNSDITPIIVAHRRKVFNNEINTLKTKARALEILLERYELPCEVCDSYKDNCDHTFVEDDEVSLSLIIDDINSGAIK